MIVKINYFIFAVNFYLIKYKKMKKIKLFKDKIILIVFMIISIYAIGYMFGVGSALWDKLVAMF